MITPAAFIAVVLLALLVGAVIPVLYQLYQALKRTRVLLDTAGPLFEKTLDQVGQAADRLNGIGSHLEAQTQMLKPLSEAAATLGHTIVRSGGWLATAMTVGGAIGPAVMAGVRALFSRTDDNVMADGRPDRRSGTDNGPDHQQPPLAPDKEKHHEH